MRRGEVEPKPTPVALSADSLKRSSTGESDGYSDYENNASYEDTDGDTDGERLVTTNKPVPTSIDDVCSLCVNNNIEFKKQMEFLEFYIVSVNATLTLQAMMLILKVLKII